MRRESITGPTRPERSQTAGPVPSDLTGPTGPTLKSRPYGGPVVTSDPPMRRPVMPARSQGLSIEDLAQRRCRSCGKSLPLHRFDTGPRGRPRAWCRTCRKATRRKPADVRQLTLDYSQNRTNDAP